MSCCEECSGDRWCPIAPLGGAGSDLTIGDIASFCGWGSSGGTIAIAAFSVGNVNCNSGTQVLHWNVPGTNKRAVVGQNMYRLTEDDANKDHRFEQSGTPEVKWGFS